MPVVTQGQWLGLRDTLTLDQQAEVIRADTLESFKEWLDMRIIARSARLKIVSQEQSERVREIAGTLEGYDG